jgi:hypothetical protein
VTRRLGDRHRDPDAVHLLHEAGCPQDRQQQRPHGAGLTDRLGTGGWKSFSQIVQLNADGSYQILDPASKQLVLIPRS